MGEPTHYDVVVGAIIGAHGVQGTVKLLPATATASSMVLSADRAPEGEAAMVWVGSSPDEGRLLRVLSAKQQPRRSVLLVRFEGINDRNGAEVLEKKTVYAPAHRRAPLNEDEFFVDDLIGLNVVTDAGRPLGRLIDVLQQPASDVYETDMGALIPAVKEFVVSIDVQNGQVVVRDVEGLLA